MRTAAAPEPQAASTRIASTPRKPDEIGDQRAQMLLAGCLAADHVAHEQRVDPARISLAQRRQDGIRGQVPDGLVPVFVDLDLSER